MLKQIFMSSPSYGFIFIEKKKFRDYDLFSSKEEALYTISKLKVWYGSTREFNDDIKGKIILGMQCEFIDIYTGDKIISNVHGGELTGDDIELYELELKNNDYIHKFYMNTDRYLTYMKILTKKGKCIECGENNEDTQRNIEINYLQKPHMINCFFGYYNNFGMNALGFRYISRFNFILFSLLEIFRLKHNLKTNEEERKKWENPENFKKLSLKMQAIVKICDLENILFNRIIGYYFSY